MQKLIKHILKGNLFLAIAIGVTLGILYLSLMQTSHLPSLPIQHLDKFFHFLAYTSLAICWFAYFVIFKKIERNLHFNTIAILLVFFGIIVEILQKNLTDYRTFDWLDILANTSGVWIVYFLFKYNKTKLGKLSQQLNG